MKRTALVALLVLATASCSTFHARMVRHFSGSNPYANDPFWVRYLAPDNPQDQQIRATLDALKLDPWSAPLHNQLGELLTKKALPKQAAVEFERAVASDHRFYPAWYNLGLIREYRGDDSGAISAFKTTLDYKPGHAAAHFQLALLYERRGRIDAAIDHYVDAIRINPHLLSPAINPRIVDSHLIGRALLRLYPSAHALDSITFEPTPASYPGVKSALPAAAPVPAPATEKPKAAPAKPETKTPPAQAQPKKQSQATPQPSVQPRPSATGVVTTPIPVTGTAPSAKPKPQKLNPFWERFYAKKSGKGQNGQANQKAEPANKSDGTSKAEQKPDSSNPKDPNQPNTNDPNDPNQPNGHSLLL